MGRSWIAGRRSDDGPDGDDEGDIDEHAETETDADAASDAEITPEAADAPETAALDEASVQLDAAGERDEQPSDAAGPDDTPTGRAAAVLAAVQRSILDITPLQWAWMAGSVVVGIAVTVLVNISRDVADGTVEGEHAEQWNSAIGQLAAVLVLLAVFYAVGWLHEVGVNSGYQRWGLRWSPFVLVACLLPALGIPGTSWEPYERIGAVAADALSDAAFEELAFRGLLMLVIGRGLSDHRHGVLISAIAVGVVYGLVDLSVGSLLLGVLFSVVFVRLLLDTNSIWPAAVLAAMFEWLGEFPYLDDGTAEGSGWTTLGIVVLVAAAAHAAVRLAREHASWQALRSPNIAPVPRR